MTEKPGANFTVGDIEFSVFYSCLFRKLSKRIGLSFTGDFANPVSPLSIKC